MVQLRHNASLELYSYAKEKMHLMPYNQNYNSETQLQHKMLAAKANFEEELILNSSSNNISRVYKCINSITRHDTIPQNVTMDSQMATSDIEKANLFSTQSLHRVHSTYTSS